MGSSGSGKFGTYHVGGSRGTSGQQPGTSNGGFGGISSGQGYSGVAGGGAGEIECPPVIEYIRLEDVAISQYYVSRNSLPNPGEAVELPSDIVNGRLVVTVSSTGEILGNLPTEYNYLINCLKRGITYIGTVASSGVSPVPFAVVSLHA